MYKEIDDKYDKEVVEVAEKLKEKDKGIFGICKEYAATDDMTRAEFIDKIKGQNILHVLNNGKNNRGDKSV